MITPLAAGAHSTHSMLSSVPPALPAGPPHSHHSGHAPPHNLMATIGSNVGVRPTAEEDVCVCALVNSLLGPASSTPQQSPDQPGSPASPVLRASSQTVVLLDGADLQQQAQAGQQASSVAWGSAAMTSQHSAQPPISPTAPMLDEVEQLLAQAAQSWSFDSFKLAEATVGHPLSTLAYFLSE